METKNNPHSRSFEEQRNYMVEHQLVSRGIRDKRVLSAMRKIPRETFFPPAQRELAYCDGAFPIGEGQTISQPYMVAKMTECLELKGTERVLEIGTGSGYQAAILAELVQQVYSVEYIKALAEKAGSVLDRLGYRNIWIKVGDGTYGWEEYAPYERIIVTAGARCVPPQLIEQLSEEKGILVIPVGNSFVQVLKVIIKDGSTISERDECACHFVPFVGEYEYI